MKRRVYAFLAVFLLITTLATAEVTFTPRDNGDGSFDILYSGRLPISLALNITLPDGLTTDYSHISVSPYYNHFPDWAFSNPMGYVFGDGHPVAETFRAGSQDGTVSHFAVSMAGFMPYAPLGFSAQDLNFDGCVDLNDMFLVEMDWLSVGPFMTDLNGDNIVNIIDVGIMNGMQYLDTSDSGVLMTIETIGYDPLANYDPLRVDLDTLRGGMYVPEPGSIALLGMGFLALLRRRQ